VIETSSKDETLVETFVKAVEAVAGHGHRVRDLGAAARKVAAICSASEAKSVALANLPDDLEAAIAEAVGAEGIACMRPPYDPATLPNALDGVDIGVTGAAFAIAETGTVAEVTEDDVVRIVSGLPRTHVAIARQSTLVPTLREAAARLRTVFAEHPDHVAVSFISGPSRTGDIEMILTLGVHGPETFHAILVEDDA